MTVKYLSEPPKEAPEPPHSPGRISFGTDYLCPSWVCQDKNTTPLKRCHTDLRDAEEFECKTCGAHYRRYSMSGDWEELRRGVLTTGFT